MTPPPVGTSKAWPLRGRSRSANPAGGGVTHRPLTLAVTAGDPCGIGPEVIVSALRHPLPPGARLLLIGEVAVFERARRSLGLPPLDWAVVPCEGVEGCPRSRILVDLGHRGTFRPGDGSARAGEAALRYLRVAVGLVREGLADGLVTGPVTKRSIALVQPGFRGQTELLGEAFGVKRLVMMFVSDRLRVALVTRHVPLGRVPQAATARLIQETVELTAEGLRRWFRIRSPRLALCGLNPHAGEGGRCGDEERRLLLPALRACARKGFAAEGPFSADGFFGRLGPTMTLRRATGHDAVICWYHDQGLIPFKLLARDEGCQLTVGLPVVRTSPDHGSALELAGRGKAHPGSMRYALTMAWTLAARSRASGPTGRKD